MQVRKPGLTIHRYSSIIGKYADNLVLSVNMPILHTKRMRMLAVLTGDVINSRNIGESKEWLTVLKTALKNIHKTNWEVYRGDSFQLKTKPEEALLNAIYIKACLKTVKDTDIRMAIGIGQKGYEAKDIGESNGEAFILSGSALENLKKEKTNLIVNTASKEFDEEINTAIRLALTFMDSWSPATASMVKAALENSHLPQQDLAEKIDKTQSSVSEALKRAHFAELKDLDNLYRKKVAVLTA